MVILLAPTVHHTGSRFLVNHLLKDFEEVPIKSAMGNQFPENDCVVFDHIWPHKMEQWYQLLGKFPAIIPLRSKSNVFDSWERRGKNLDELMWMWNMMGAMIDRFNPYVINLDSANRDNQISVINKQLGLSLNPAGWPVINSIREQPKDDKQTDN